MLQIRMTVLFSVLLFEIASILTSGITTLLQCLIHQSNHKIICVQEPEVSELHYEGEIICMIYSTMWKSVWDLHNRGEDSEMP